MMRIAFVTGGLALGGTSTFMLFLSAALRRQGVPVEIFSFSADHPLAGEFNRAGVPVWTADEQRLIFEDRLQQLWAHLRDFRPTVVFAVLGTEAFELLRYLPPGVARIGIFHDRAIRPQEFGARYRGVMHHLVVVANYLREEMRQMDPGFPCTYLAHGIPLPEPIFARSEPEPSAPLRLLYYGRLENASKGVRLFPEIVKALKQQQVPFVWTIHGYGPEESFLKSALAEEVIAGRVKFSSPLPYHQLPGLVGQHDVYVLTSTNEGGPLTLLEAMALGLVPVCGDIPCLVQEVITSVNGFRVPQAEAAGYARAIALLHADRRRLGEMSRQAKATIVADFSADAMAQRYLKFSQAVQPSAEAISWPAGLRVRPVLETPPWLFSGPLRTLRRLAKRLR